MRRIPFISTVAVALASAFGVLGEAGKSAGRSALDFMANAIKPRSFNQRYGNNPPSINGGQRSGVAAAKRAKAKRVNVGKHKAAAHKGSRRSSRAKPGTRNHGRR